MSQFVVNNNFCVHECDGQIHMFLVGAVLRSFIILLRLIYSKSKHDDVVDHHGTNMTEYFIFLMFVQLIFN